MTNLFNKIVNAASDTVGIVGGTWMIGTLAMPYLIEAGVLTSAVVMSPAAQALPILIGATIAGTSGLAYSGIKNIFSKQSLESVEEPIENKEFLDSRFRFMPYLALYALGMSAYTAATGQPMTAGETTMTTEELLRMGVVLSLTGGMVASFTKSPSQPNSP